MANAKMTRPSNVCWWRLRECHKMTWSDCIRKGMRSLHLPHEDDQDKGDRKLKIKMATS